MDKMEHLAIRLLATALFVLLLCWHFISGEWRKFSRIGLRATWAGAMEKAYKEWRAAECQ